MRKRHPFLTVCGVILIILVISGGVTALVGWGLGWFDNEETEVIDELEDEEDTPEAGETSLVLPGTGVVEDWSDNEANDDDLLTFDEE